jgi:toxin ParE1/3/4
MTAKSIVPRVQARRDIEEAVDFYAREAGETVVLGFIGALESAYRGIASHPASGSPRYSYELDLPCLRTRSLKRFPYIIFYMERDDHIDIWRVLQAQRDIPAWMQEPEGA